MYMSPEQAEGDMAVDARCDLFSLGGVLYRMSTGELPFKGKTTMAVLTALATKKPRPPIEIVPDMPPALSDFILKLLEKNPDDRPKNARAVVEALAEIREAPFGYEEVEEDVVVLEEVIEVEPDPPPKPKSAPAPAPRSHSNLKAKSKPRSKSKLKAAKHERTGKHEPKKPKEYDPRALERRVIKLAIFAGVCVFLFLAAMIIKKRFFPTEPDPKGQTKPAVLFVCRYTFRAPSWSPRQEAMTTANFTPRDFFS
jgi:serine/threonine protein kinase